MCLATIRVAKIVVTVPSSQYAIDTQRAATHASMLCFLPDLLVSGIIVLVSFLSIQYRGKRKKRILIFDRTVAHMYVIIAFSLHYVL
jgi:hypothetical protein